jgi:hypothetical protein
MQCMTNYKFPELPLSYICITRWMEFIPVSVDEAVHFVFSD